MHVQNDDFGVSSHIDQKDLTNKQCKNIADFSATELSNVSSHFCWLEVVTLKYLHLSKNRDGVFIKDDI